MQPRQNKSPRPGRRRFGDSKTMSILDRPRLFSDGAKPEDGVPDMTVISDIDEYGINTNLKVRYQKDRIYVSMTAQYVRK